VDAVEVEVTAEAEQAWVDRLADNPLSFLGSPDCTPGYYNNEGGPIGRRERLNSSGYPGGPVAYWDHIERWRTDGSFVGVEFRPAAPVG
jgi:hypothetical protein